MQLSIMGNRFHRASCNESITSNADEKGVTSLLFTGSLRNRVPSVVELDCCWFSSRINFLNIKYCFESSLIYKCNRIDTGTELVG